MLSLTDRVSIDSALDDPDLDDDLRNLIGLRLGQTDPDRDGNQQPPFKLIVIQGGDTPEVIDAAVGFPVTGGSAEVAWFDWIEDHGRWFEIASGRDLGAPTLIFVENGPATELGIHYLCLTHCWTDDENGR